MKNAIASARRLACLWNDRRGVTVIEYGLIGALIGVALIGSLTTLQGKIATLFGNIGTALGT